MDRLSRCSLPTRSKFASGFGNYNTRLFDLVAMTSRWDRLLRPVRVYARVADEVGDVHLTKA